MSETVDSVVLTRVSHEPPATAELDTVEVQLRCSLLANLAPRTRVPYAWGPFDKSIVRAIALSSKSSIAVLSITSNRNDSCACLYRSFDLWSVGTII